MVPALRREKMVDGKSEVPTEREEREWNGLWAGMERAPGATPLRCTLHALCTHTHRGSTHTSPHKVHAGFRPRPPGTQASPHAHARYSPCTHWESTEHGRPRRSLGHYRTPDALLWSQVACLVALPLAHRPLRTGPAGVCARL